MTEFTKPIKQSKLWQCQLNWRQTYVKSREKSLWEIPLIIMRNWIFPMFHAQWLITLTAKGSRYEIAFEGTNADFCDLFVIVMHSNFLRILKRFWFALKLQIEKKWRISKIYFNYHKKIISLNKLCFLIWAFLWNVWQTSTRNANFRENFNLCCNFKLIVSEIGSQTISHSKQSQITPLLFDMHKLCIHNW